MPGEELNENTVCKVFDSGNVAQIEEFFSKWNFANANSTSFEMTEREKNVLGDKIAEKIEVDELTAILLETLRLIGRERHGLESLLNKDLCDKVIMCAGLTHTDGYPKTTHALIEAQKCLVNTMFHSMRMRERFYANPDTTDRILLFLTEFEESRRKKSQILWIRDMNPTQAADVWFFYYRIVFIATAMSQDFQKKLTMKPDIVDTLFLAVENIFVDKPEIPAIDYQRAGEAMKTFFNTFCHFQKDVVEILDEEHALKACRLLRDVILSDRITDEIRQNAIHALSVPPVPMLLSVLCSDPTKPIPSAEEHNPRDLRNMVLTETVLTALDKQLTVAVAMLNAAAPDGQVHKDGQTLVDLVGPYFQFLARLCVESKHVRRYCRLRVLPPLVAEEVKKRPEEHNTLRGRIVRVMMLPSSTKEVAAEFLFIICKRSVNRMIKYVGFGHSAGHLANMGLLGQINQPKHASDSEDSETEDYNAVKDSVNPVTGAMYPPDHGSALAGMSDAQKEFEAMKLVDAMNKMMDQGLVKPGTIGEDGRLREVSHVLELVKNVPDEKGSDSDSD